MVASADISFACTRCGQCCNSPPRLSLAELFRLSDKFIGCLAVFWLRAGGRAARMALFDRLAFRAPGPNGATHIAIQPQGYAYDSQGVCPALGDGGLCTLHQVGKPLQCRAVPLDPLLPDDEQGAVLTERMGDAAFRAGGCLRENDAAVPPLLLHAGRVADAAAASAMSQRRAEMGADRAAWGFAVFDMLRRELAHIPPQGYVALPMVPAIVALGGGADCVQFLDRQVASITRAVDAARTRRNPADRVTTRRIEEWRTTYRESMPMQEKKARQGRLF